MSYESIAQSAASWALSKVGCSYSQAKRTQEKIFDCSSLVARAYTAQGKKWRYGGSVPRSNEEVYDDDFELLWPSTYAEIGKRFGGTSVIKMAKQPGDLQFLCTDAGTSRSNRITHIAMVANSDKIVHARGTAYGVCTNSISHYSGKVCAIARYNPACTLRSGMKGIRTLLLQQTLNKLGAKLTEDGDYGSSTTSAVEAYQIAAGISATGQADTTTLKKLGLLGESIEPTKNRDDDLQLSSVARITGGSVNIRSGPGTDYPSIKIAHQDESYIAVDIEGWQPILLDGNIRWISKKYIQINPADK